MRGSRGFRCSSVCTTACALLAVLALALAGVCAPVGFAAELNPGSSFEELAQKSRQAETETTPEPTSTETTSNSKSTILLAFIGAGVLLSGIVFVIVRDVRKVAPATDVEAIEARSARDNAVRLQKRKAKAKAARQQRKRTRNR